MAVEKQMPFLAAWTPSWGGNLFARQRKQPPRPLRKWMLNLLMFIYCDVMLFLFAKCYIKSNFVFLSKNRERARDGERLGRRHSAAWIRDYLQVLGGPKLVAHQFFVILLGISSEPSELKPLLLCCVTKCLVGFLMTPWCVTVNDLEFEMRFLLKSVFGAGLTRFFPPRCILSPVCPLTLRGIERSFHSLHLELHVASTTLPKCG